MTHALYVTYYIYFALQLFDVITISQIRLLHTVAMSVEQILLLEQQPTNVQ